MEKGFPNQNRKLYGQLMSWWRIRICVNNIVLYRRRTSEAWIQTQRDIHNFQNIGYSNTNTHKLTIIMN